MTKPNPTGNLPFPIMLCSVPLCGNINYASTFYMNPRHTSALIRKVLFNSRLYAFFTRRTHVLLSFLSLALKLLRWVDLLSEADFLPQQRVTKVGGDRIDLWINRPSRGGTKVDGSEMGFLNTREDGRLWEMWRSKVGVWTVDEKLLMMGLRRKRGTFIHFSWIWRFSLGYCCAVR